MKADYTNDFADFLEERLGKVLFALREKNKEYRSLSDEYVGLLNAHYQSVDEYKQAISKIADIGDKLGDIEKRYLFLAGMREHTKMEAALSSKTFEELFAGIK